MQHQIHSFLRRIHHPGTKRLGRGNLGCTKLNTNEETTLRSSSNLTNRVSNTYFEVLGQLLYDGVTLIKWKQLSPVADDFWQTESGRLILGA
jgi:hypothetical protein